jgi:hypothetical protein
VTFEDDLLALERRVLEDAGGDFFRAVADLRRMLAAEEPGLPAKLAEVAIPRLGNEAALAANDAWDLGGQRALDSAQERGVDANILNDADLRLVGRPAHLTDPFTGLDALLADAKTRAVALLHSGADAETASAPLFQAATTARSRIVTQVNAASNAAAVEVGDATRSPMVWEAERDACVFCLALAGEVVEKAGDHFPLADLYAPTPASMTTTSAPPLHPHCRCRLAILVDQSYADALKREAQRSILRGHSLPSESQAVRVRAAERLLAADPVAPKTVKAFAAAAVKRGHFPTREVPKGDPRLIIERGGPAAPAKTPAPSPKPPSAPEVDPFDIPEPPLRGQITKASAADAARAAVIRHGIPFTGWEGMSPTVAREAIAQLSELLDRFPARFVKIAGARDPKLRVGNRTMAYVATKTGEDAGSMHFIRAHMTEKRLAEAGKANHEGGFLSGKADTWQDALRHTVTHEFVHGLDANVGKALTRLYIAELDTAKAGMSFNEQHQWTLANLSKYGRSSPGEGVAELLADGLTQGEDATPFARAFLPKALHLLEENL